MQSVPPVRVMYGSSRRKSASFSVMFAVKASTVAVTAEKGGTQPVVGTQHTRWISRFGRRFAMRIASAIFTQSGRMNGNTHQPSAVSSPTEPEFLA